MGDWLYLKTACMDVVGECFRTLLYSSILKFLGLPTINLRLVCRDQMQYEESQSIDTEQKEGADDEIKRLVGNATWYKKQIDSKILDLETIYNYLSKLSTIISHLNVCVDIMNKRTADTTRRLASLKTASGDLYNAVSNALQGELDLVSLIEENIAELDKFVKSRQSHINEYVRQVHSDTSKDVKRRILPLPTRKNPWRSSFTETLKY